MSGLHLLALLGGIYLMIFVMEPVAVPNHLISQHYFGVPWGPERRTNAMRTQLPIQLITEPFPEHSYKDNVEIKQKSTILQRNSFDQSPQIKNTSNSDTPTTYSPYRFLLSNYSQNAQPDKTSHHASYLLNSPRKLPSNKPNVHHWHHNSTETASDKVVYSKEVNVNAKRTPISGLIVGNDRLINRNTGTEKAYNATGSAKSVDIKDLRL